MQNHSCLVNLKTMLKSIDYVGNVLSQSTVSSKNNAVHVFNFKYHIKCLPLNRTLHV